MRHAAHLLIVGASLAAAPALAADTFFTGLLDLRAGYGANPYLRSPSQGGSILLGGTLQGALNSRTARSTTVLSGTADVAQNLNKYGRNENYRAELRRDQTFSDRVMGQAGIFYSNTINPGQLGGFYADPNAIGGPVGLDSSTLDLLTIGQRTETYGVDAGAQWQVSSRDQFSVSGNASHVSFSNLGADYDQYGGSLGYMRSLDARTSVGLTVSGNEVDSDTYGNTSSINVSANVRRQLSSIWVFDGSVGVITPHGVTSGSGTSLGFSASLCGKYPRANVCFSAARQSTPSGIGGLRNNLTFTAQLQYDLDERQTVTVEGNYNRSAAGGGTLIVPKQEFYQASGSYSRRLSRRVSVGGSARYQRRDYGVLGTASSYSVTIDVTTRLGRASS